MFAERGGAGAVLRRARRVLLAASILASVSAVSPGSPIQGAAHAAGVRARPPARPGAEPPGASLIVDRLERAPRDAVESLERAGFGVAVALPTSAYYVFPPAGGALPAGMSETRAVEAAPRGTGAEPGFDPFGGRADLLPPVEPSAGARGAARSSGSIGLHYGTRWGDTSEFLVGSVAVSILLPESDGSIDPSRFDWTPTLRDSVMRSVATGLLRWSARAAARGIPLTFVLEVRSGLPTSYEPIEHPVADEGLWMTDVLEPLVGSKGSWTDLAYAYANAARARLGTQWATLVFAVQNDTDPDGAFADGNIAYAHLGGPWLVLPVNNLNTSAGLDFYVEHEMGHLFWALDEYPANNAWWGCDLTTGYFNQPNANSVIPAPNYCFSNVTCVMRGNYPGIVCGPTESIVGWADRDHNGILDLFETRPGVTPDSARVHAVSGTVVSLRGIAADRAIPNTNPYRFFAGDSISVAIIDSILYRVEGGPWISIAPEDGVFDEGGESFVASLGPFAPGSYKVQWQAWNSNGRSAEKAETTRVDVAPPSQAAEPPESGGLTAAGIRLRAGPVPAAGPVRLSLLGRGGASGEGRLYDAQGRLVRRWRLEIPASGRLDWTWDADGDGAAPASGLYFLSVEAGGARTTRRLVILR